MTSNNKSSSEPKPLNRRKFMKTTASFVAAASTIGLNSSYSHPGKKRNIIFILSDDHRYDALSCLNHPLAKTPNMDRLLTNGIHLKNAFVTHSLCSPSRATILTGLYSYQHNVLDNSTELDDRLPTFPKLLQQAGYKTGFVGKWHMGGANDNPRPGFDHWVSFRGQGLYFDNVYNINGERKLRKGYVSDVLTDFAIDFIRNQQEQPFCLYLSHKAVHEDFDPAPRHIGKFNHITPPRPVTYHNTDENYDDKPDWVRKQRYSCHGVDGLSYTHKTGIDGLYRRYAECLLGLDDGIGALTAFLEKEDLLNDTLIIYMGDNGFQFGEHGLIDKRVMYEESIRVPMFVHCPALNKGGQAVEELILNNDIAPTILEAAGVPVPKSMYGQSFYPSITGQPLKNWRHDFLYQYFWEEWFPMTPTIRGLRTDKYSYMKSYGTWDINELYDMENDPQQTRNLLGNIPLKRTITHPEKYLDKHITDPELRQLIRKFDKRIEELVKETGGNIKPDWGKM